MDSDSGKERLFDTAMAAKNALLTTGAMLTAIAVELKTSVMPAIDLDVSAGAIYRRALDRRLAAKSALPSLNNPDIEE